MQFILRFLLLTCLMCVAEATDWALLVAGSKGYENYRHQAGVCHAYQLLRRGGMNDTNIVTFMFDDIACNAKNPYPGYIFNNPRREDVYRGVLKDYTGKDVNADNFFAVLLGDKKRVRGGSGKVIDSKANDRIFLYYSDHGGPGFIGMPVGRNIHGSELITNLNSKYRSQGYQAMVIYVEACESGSLFEGKMPLPDDINVYATTASNATANSYGTYCSKDVLTCLGDEFSVAWMEDSETHNRKEETLQEQYNRVKDRTFSSQVKQYGNISMGADKLYYYQGFDPDFLSLNRDPDQEIVKGLCTSLITDDNIRLSPPLYFLTLFLLFVSWMCCS